MERLLTCSCALHCPISSLLMLIPECSNADGYSSSGHPTPLTKLLLVEDLTIPLLGWETDAVEKDVPLTINNRMEMLGKDIHTR